MQVDAFKHLARWNWPYCKVAEDDAVREDTPGHFRIAIGGKMEAKAIHVEVGARAPIVPMYFLSRPQFIIFRPVNADGGIKLSLSCKEGSLSVLVPGQDDLLRRHCQGMYKQKLRA